MVSVLRLLGAEQISNKSCTHWNKRITPEGETTAIPTNESFEAQSSRGRNCWLLWYTNSSVVSLVPQLIKVSIDRRLVRFYSVKGIYKDASQLITRPRPVFLLLPYSSNQQFSLDALISPLPEGRFPLFQDPMMNMYPIHGSHFDHAAFNYPNNIQTLVLLPPVRPLYNYKWGVHLALIDQIPWTPRSPNLRMQMQAPQLFRFWRSPPLGLPLGVPLELS